MLQMWTNEVDYVIAETKDRATELTCKSYGCRPDDMTDMEWLVYSPDKHFRFHDEQRFGGEIVRDRPAQWFIDVYGEGYFACTEW